MDGALAHTRFDTAADVATTARLLGTHSTEPLRAREPVVAGLLNTHSTEPLRVREPVASADEDKVPRVPGGEGGPPGVLVDVPGVDMAARERKYSTRRAYFVLAEARGMANGLSHKEIVERAFANQTQSCRVREEWTMRQCTWAGGQRRYLHVGAINTTEGLGNAVVNYVG